MTSVNVFYLDFIEPCKVEYDPMDRSTWVLPKVLHRVTIHTMTETKYDWDKILSLPMDETYVRSWGYDEEDEEWNDQEGTWDEETGEFIEPDPMPTLREWIERVKPVFKELKERLDV